MSSPWTDLAAGIPGILVCAAISWLGLFRTHQLQRMAAERLRRYGETPAFNWALVQSPYYLWGLRLIGLAAGAAALFLVYALIAILVPH
jgi:hypothetical protein